MSILEQLRKAISEYRGPLPAVGDSPEELWLRQAFKQLLELERGEGIMSRSQKLALIWKHTHRDYRGKINGERAILVFRSGNGTCSVPLTALTDAEVADKLSFAERQEAKRGNVA
jgi:hypothetical protein